MDYDESSDILGGRLHLSPQSSSAWSDPGQITLLLGLGLAAFYTWARLAPHYRQWKEMRYKKATRRRHGIPDDDNRPFNVAYAAAKQAKRDGKGRPYMKDGPELVAGEEGDTVAAPGLPIIPSFVQSVAYGNTYRPPSVKAEASQSTLDLPTVQSGSQRERTPQTLPRLLPNGSVSRKPRPSGAKQPLATRTSYGKHALDDESDSESEMLAKKSRLEGEELIDGDEQAEWHGSDEDMEVDEAQPVKRGSKRVASSEDEEGLDHSRTVRRDKRARKVSLDKSAQSPDESMEEDLEDGEEDGGEDLEDVARGKKRDRVEAGSTFGGDDYMMDDEGEEPKRRRRKGRVSNKLGESLSRGQKRGRGSHSTESDDSESERPRQRVMRKKRGRKSQEDIVPLSNDPLCKGRPIGEEWESHGILFKVGPNGQRLRQELVKKSRSKFPMPSDSQHPDRRAHVDVYVEVWLSEEEYKLAKERHELAWQDSSPTPPELQGPVDIPESPSKVAGKNLLWSSTISSRESPVKRGPLKQSAATNAGLRVAVFPPPPALSTRRISSVYHPPASPAAESPKLQKTKSYSKWEKQDLEAAAMSKIRDRQQSTRIANGVKASPLSGTPSTTPAAPPLTTTPSLFGTPSTATTSDKAAEKSSTPTVPSSKGTTATVSKTSTMELPKISTTSAASTTSDAPFKPAATFSFAPTAPASNATTAPASVPQPAAGSTISNFFAKPAVPATTAALVPASTTSSIPNFFSKPAAPPSVTPVPASIVSQPTFSFGVTPAQQATTATASPFGNPSSVSSDSTKASEQAKAATSASLLSRLGNGPPPSQSAASSPFFFAKPETTTPAASTTEAAKTANPAPTLVAASGPLKFNFGVASKPASASSTPAPTTTVAPVAPAAPSAPAAFTPAAASSTPKFSFGVTGSSQPAAVPSAPTNPFGGTPTNTAAPSSSAAKSSFSFGTPSAPASNLTPFGGASSTTSAFGTQSGTSSASSPFGAAASNAAKPAEPMKPTFGFGTANGIQPTTNVSPFGGPSPSPFGASAASPAPSPFGTVSAKPTEAPKSAFSFGNTGSSTSATPSPFGNAAQKTDTQTTKPAFGFGASSAPAPTFAATSGAVATQESKSTFGFGAPASTTTAASFAAPAAGSAAAPFSFNFGQSSNAATNPSHTPAASGPQPNGQGSGSFGFGAPSNGAFSFGSNPGQNQQQK